MTQENKDLLLTCLCSMLPYKLKCYIYTIRADGKKENWALREVTPNLINLFLANNDYCIVPYLRPMSSMTEEEKEKYQYITERWMYDANYSIADSIDWLNAHHFDYRGLIEKGLAIEVTEETIYK